MQAANTKVIVLKSVSSRPDMRISKGFTCRYDSLRQQGIMVWSNTDVLAGENTVNEIKKFVVPYQKTIVVNLISVDFLNDLSLKAVTATLMDYSHIGLFNLNVLLRPCNFKSWEILSRYTTFAEDKPISILSSARREIFWKDLCQYIVDTFQIKPFPPSYTSFCLDIE